MIARRAILSGRVQGVGFRFFAERAARDAGVTGWVRNCSDGSVETIVEGRADAVARYLERLRAGPGGSRVTLFTEEEAQLQGYDSFEITR